MTNAEKAFLDQVNPGVYPWGRVDVTPRPQFAWISKRLTIGIRVYRPDVDRRHRRSMNLQYGLLRDDGPLFYLVAMLGWIAGLLGVGRLLELDFIPSLGLGFVGMALALGVFFLAYQPLVGRRLSRQADYVRTTKAVVTPGRISTSASFTEAFGLVQSLIRAQSQEEQDRRWRELYGFLELHEMKGS